MEYRINFIRNSFIRFWKDHEPELLAAIMEIGRKGDWVLREAVSALEDRLAGYTGTKFGIGVNSGTDALFLSLKALGVGPGDEVITVSHTFIATIQAIVNCGATPVLVDVGTDELMDMDAVERAITKKTRVIMPVHFHGKVCDMNKLKAIIRIAESNREMEGGLSGSSVSEKGKIYVVEDAAQALGSKQYCQECHTYKMAGSFGDLGCFSFNTPKLLGGFGDGGGIVTSSRDLAEKLYLLRNHYNMAQTSVRMLDFPTPDIVEWGWKSRLDNIQAAMLNVKWKYFDQLLARRKEIANMYCEGLKDLGIKLPEYSDDDVIQEFIIRIGDSEKRKRFKEHMDKKGIELLIRETTPNHKVKNLGLDHFNLPITESISTDAVRLPAYPELYDSEVREIIAATIDFIDQEPL